VSQRVGVHRSEQARDVSSAQARVGVSLCDLQEQTGLTDVQMLEAVHRWAALILKGLRIEEETDAQSL
jgi:hypothetical protein